MSRKLLLLAILAFPILMFAQHNPLEDQIYRTSGSTNIQVYGGAFQASDVIPLEAAWRILQNESITTALRDKMASKTGAKNRYEDWLRTGIFYEGFAKADTNGRTGWYVGLEYANQRQIFFPEDAFNLVFFGNAPYEDDTLFIPDLTFQDLSYNRLRFGFSHSIYQSGSSLSISAGVSLYQGIGHTRLGFQNTSIYTAPDGEYLDIVYDTRIEQSNPGARKLGDFSGFGAALDLAIQWQKGDDFIRFDAQELGFIRWSNDELWYYGDSSIRYEGLIIEDISGGAGTPLTSIDIDSLAEALGLYRGVGSYGRNLPARINLQYLHMPAGGGVVYGGNLHYRPLKGYLPEISAMGGYRFGSSESASYTLTGRLAYGGFGGFQMGLGARMDWKPIHLSIQAPSLLGFFSPSNIPGGSLLIGLGAHF
jgi:hypothetical protein